MSSKIIYADLSLKGMNLNIATQLKNEALPTISKLLGNMMLHDHVGRLVSVAVQLDEFAYDQPIFMQAKASHCGDAHYLIEIGLGLISQLSLISKSIATNKHALRGRTKSKLLQPDIRKNGREHALGDFVFHYMLAFVMFHEVAHVALGHLDWLQKNAQLYAIEEFGYDSQIPQSAFIHEQTLEGDADRQASLWTAAVTDYSISNNPFLQYSCLADVFYDIGYIYGALFIFLDSVDKDVPAPQRKHPKADVRLGIALSFVEEYLQRYHKDSCAALMKQVYSGGIKALSTIFHTEKRPFDLLSSIKFMAENGQRIDNMKLRLVQHKVTNSTNSSFIIR